MNRTLQDILCEFREDARTNRDLGDRFERLMHRFFELDPLYAEEFDRVWMWNDWPDKGKVGDVGIDLVARVRATGEYCGIQCKFYLPEHTISKPDLDSFFTALGKPALSRGIIVSTTDRWGPNALDALNQSKPVTRLGVTNLLESPIDWSKFDPRRLDNLTLTKQRQLREHQKAALHRGPDRARRASEHGDDQNRAVPPTIGRTVVIFIFSRYTLNGQLLRYTALSRTRR
jgi:predicted helicase